MRLHRGRLAQGFELTAVPCLTDVYRVARQMSDETRAQDLVQETYLRAWKYFDTFEPGTNCRAWLLRILHNVWADQWRRPRLEIPLEVNEEATTEPYYDWEDEFLKDEFSEGLGQALSQLPDVNRWAVLLVDVEELSYLEAARIMNCPVGTIMSRINRGRRTLARRLREDAENQLAEVSNVMRKSQEEK